ncbi:hypothetical protein Q7C36_019448 [Tachysurus vachellii]|uniref:Uncharacterized protein n=1 Tax=Tachysurus vachellii TaxID=175792 RepID=A0AA88LWG3_TACVA|nr:hypothetical protein Q7C36_019448 [Tachysurus vachellii]
MKNTGECDLEANDEGTMIKEMITEDNVNAGENTIGAEVNENETRIDMKAFFHEEKESTHTPPRNENTSIFGFPDPHDYLSTPKTEKQGTARKPIRILTSPLAAMLHRLVNLLLEQVSDAGARACLWSSCQEMRMEGWT